MYRFLYSRVFPRNSFLPSRDFLQDERDFPTKINNAVFPALQGGPHEHQIAGVATQLLEAMTPEFKEYIVQVRPKARIQQQFFSVQTAGFGLFGTSPEVCKICRFRAEACTRFWDPRADCEFTFRSCKI